MIDSSCFCRSVYFLCTYRNDSNNRPGHLINLSVFLPGTYSFSHKIWGGQKRQFKKIHFITVALSLSFSSDTHIDAISGISTQNSFHFSTVFLKILQYSNKHLIKLCEVYLGA